MIEDTCHDRQGSMVPEHETYEQLCALASSGALKSDEWSRLGDHLKVCGSCRQDVAKYQEITTFGISLIAPNDVSLDVENEWSPETAVAKLMRILQERRGEVQEQVQSITPCAVSHRRILRRPIPRLRSFAAGAVALSVVAVVSGLFYLVGMRKGEARASGVSSVPGRSENILNTLVRQRADLELQLQSYAEEIEQLSRQLADERTAFDRLQNTKQSADQSVARLMQKLGAQGTQNASLLVQYDTIQKEREGLAEQLKVSEATLLAVQHTLKETQDQQIASTAQIAKLEDQIALLSRQSHSAEYVEARQLTSSDPDPDLRALMGARDLFIADVYDIDKTGSPRKPFGRVFYTRGKSLLFYAFDLDKQPGVKAASTFQVWGRKGYGDSHPINMGMMYLDSDTSKRWVLKYDDAAALAQVDAVFVTIEPRGGSKMPKGPQFLYASLRTPVNHP